ncbi:Glycoside hydrolase, 38 vacuolar alpha mannosidase [Apophysomyces sp. BC1034]|nr:Glycoside hydrolase, 38 vacuolar alpha mannosidase [Apophysomyces sp. BC1015]KAG0176730.1 Glycoside hydrolase, 38 vacuolar alpha mannosidase [Apophysomyces sp. BC1021]KAG0193847.1 Glycoside hydrolase, 38 vacuolar alpha mannosidase [Apophysomyces sp. BC1034]
MSSEMPVYPSLDNAPRVPSNITRSRIDNFLSSSGQFHSMGIHRGLWELRHSGEPHVLLRVHSVPGLKRITFKEAVSQTFETVKQTSFGPSWSTHWFYISVTIPEALNGRDVIFQWDMGCEGMVWSTEGVPLQGLTGGLDQARHEYPLTKKAKAGDQFRFYIEAACNGMFGVGNGAMVPEPNRYFTLDKADIVVPSYSVQDLYHDLTIIRGIAYDTDSSSPRARTALHVANQVINEFILDDPEAIKRCKALTTEFLSHGNGTGVHEVTAIGNCHIDSAWLWTYDETKRKVARSWSSQLNLMEQYPEYVFTGSQVQQYEWLKELYPAVFEKIQEKEKTGQWEIIGGSWVEHDTNMPNGESLCRQMLLGQRFFEEHFGKRTNVFWLPDTFGYSGQLPQVLKQSGCDYFFTQKLSWNNINKFPLTTFWWTGIDNTRVLAHLTPAETYTASATPAELHKCATNNHDLEGSKRSLLVYGHGDGGGGPTQDMLERVRRMKNVYGLPVCKPGNVTDFFKTLEATSENLQAYKGELYLELHRGTYTTQALVKRGNRKGEVLLRDLEFLATAATLLGNKGRTSYSYPTHDITKLWKLLCLNQFHDCLPGSAIGLAYKDVHKFHREVISESLSLRHKAQDAIMNDRSNSTEINTNTKEGLVVFNTLPWNRSELLVVPNSKTSWINQQWSNGHEYVVVNDVHGFGATAFIGGSDIRQINSNEKATAYKTESGDFVLENFNLKATFNADGQLLQLVDKRSNRKPLVPEGARGNVLMLYEDVPTYWDAWDVEIYHLQKGKKLQGNGSVTIAATGPLKAELKFVQNISKESYIEQTISLSCIGERIEFNNFVDWHESHQFLKVEFVWDIVSDHATYDIQYGVVRRPNHYNTTHDSSRFEVCGHKFADLSEASYGIALMNDCKYGYATHENTQRLSLLRSPKGPDENADMGEHNFKYAIYPHEGNFEASNVVKEALEFNTPLSVRYVKGDVLENSRVIPSLFTLDPPDRVILDTVKLAEDDKGQGKVVILRLFEAYGGQETTTFTSSLKIKRIVVSNILEDDTQQELDYQDNSTEITLKPFQILTLKLYIK